MTKKNFDEDVMLRCIELARKGSGYVSPNPMVGCVIVKNGFEISEGYHKKFGENHAEVNTINAALHKGLDLTGSTLYVNLEPCSHFGKTPPCVDKIIENKIAKVVIGTKDPNPLVAGKGIKKLIRAGIDVKVGVIESFCLELNKFYFKYIRSGLPYVTLKAAQTLDGKINDSKNKPVWISSEESRKLVHVLRSQYDAVLVGRKTVETDNPQLNVRYLKGRNPYRILIDSKFKIDVRKKIFGNKKNSKTIVITSREGYLSDLRKRKYLEDRDVIIIAVRQKNGRLNLSDALKEISKLGIISILVEGGAFTFSEFIKQNLVDEIMLFIAPKIFGNGLNIFNLANKDQFIIKNFSWKKSGEDILVNFKIA